MNEKKAISVLKEVNQTFRRYSIKYWLVGGVLLGAVRSRKFIPWDEDIDLAIWHDELQRILKNKKIFQELDKKNFQIYLLEDKLILEKKSIPVKISIFKLKKGKARRELLSYKNGVGKFFKIFWWILSVKYYNGIKTKNLTNLETLVKHALLLLKIPIPKKVKEKLRKKLSTYSKKIGCHYTIWSVPSYFFKEFSTLKFYGEKFKVPKKTIEYLTFRYGPDWNIPTKKWNTIKEDGAVSNKNKLKGDATKGSD